jgi:hypothetical protein
LIGDGEQQHDERLLVLWLDLDNVPTDAFRRRGVVEQAIALGFLQRRGNSRR